MRRLRVLTGSVVIAAFVLGACGSAATRAPSDERPTVVPGTSDPGEAATPIPVGGADLVVRATGAAAACKTFATLAGCAAFLRIQPIGKTAVVDLAFPGEAATEATLEPGLDWPKTLAPGRYRITAHLDRVGSTVVLPPATPEHWVDRTCQATVTVAEASTKVTVTVTFNLDRACRVSASIAPSSEPTTKPEKTRKPKKTPRPTP
jgi:hypothetical protein